MSEFVNGFDVNACKVNALRLIDDCLEVLDQRRLPGELVYDTCRSASDVAEAIASMRVRGAPAIGIAAAYGVALAARDRFHESPAQWRANLQSDLDLLAQSRPTAVNLFWALERMQDVVNSIQGDPYPHLLRAATAIHHEDVAANLAMAAKGAAVLAGASGLLTHCNTGSLATGGFGTALGVVRRAWAEWQPAIYATETRPWLQGARLTVWELEQDGIPATLIVDSAAAHLMKEGRVQWVIVGADRIAANGDAANKIGTYALAVAARYHGVGFMVVAPTSTVDWDTPAGDRIEIEERDKRELLSEHFLRDESLVKAWNPVFDVTPASLIDALVTEKGVVRNPTADAMRAILA